MDHNSQQGLASKQTLLILGLDTIRILGSGIVSCNPCRNTQAVRLAFVLDEKYQGNRASIFPFKPQPIFLTDQLFCIFL
jgi:hypothetical protein